MPQIETWSRLPQAIRQHLIERMHDRKISLDDLNRLRIWMETKPEVPEGNWYKDYVVDFQLHNYQITHLPNDPFTK